VKGIAIGGRAAGHCEHQRRRSLYQGERTPASARHACCGGRDIPLPCGHRSHAAPAIFERIMPGTDDNRTSRRTRHSLAEGTERETGRLEAFSDAIFAIAITLLILDVKLPPSEGEEHLLRSLLGLWPSYCALAFSFLIIGIYWSNHHYIFKLYRKTDHFFNLLQLLFLLTISILPFPTRVLADYLEAPSDRATGVAFYTLGLLLPSATWFATWMYARYNRIIDPELDGKFVRRLTIQYGLSVVFFLLALLLTVVVSVWIGLALAVGLTLLYLLPPPKPLYNESAR
jgi:uncharacterized membrane protein